MLNDQVAFEYTSECVVLASQQRFEALVFAIEVFLDCGPMGTQYLNCFFDSINLAHFLTDAI